MDEKLKKYLLLSLVMVFAFLQAVSPLIHAHIKGDNLHSTASLHIHILPALDDTESVMKNVTPSGFEDVNQSILRDVSLDFCAFFFVLVTFLAFAKQQLFFIPPSKNLLSSVNLRHHPLIPRAPPSF